MINKAKIASSDVLFLGTQYQTIFALFDNIVLQGSRVAFVRRKTGLLLFRDQEVVYGGVSIKLAAVILLT